MIRNVAALVVVLLALLVLAGAPSPGAATPVLGASVAPSPLPSIGAAAPLAEAASASASGPVVVAPAYTPGRGVADQGPIPASTPLDVVVGLASSDPAGLASLANEVSAPGGSAYHRALAASAASARFGASTTTTATARSYFARFGLTTRVNPDGLLLDVTGPAKALGHAFGTTFDLYRASSGRTFFAHPTPATLPPIAPWTGVFGLGNSTSWAQPFTTPAPAGSVHPFASCPVPAPGTAFRPCQLQAGYDFSPLLSSGTNGSGVRLGVVDAYSGAEPQTQLVSDLSLFSTNNGLPPGNVSFVYPVPTTIDLNATGVNPLWQYEDALDLEWSHASAPGAGIVMAFSPDSGAGLYFAIDALVATGAVNVLSLSWGEPDVGVFNSYSTPCISSCNASTDGSYTILGPVFQLAAVEGISTFAASGDCGAADGTSGVSTNYPASDPFVTGVGGTNVTLTAANAWHAEVAWSGNATGARSPGCSNQGGSGGGFSPFPRPWWQLGPGIATTQQHRGVPDVSINGGLPVSIEVGSQPTTATGTSVGTPIWAGIAALADQYAGIHLGFLDPTLYTLLRSPGYTSCFHDITDGHNNYRAGVGWDPVTGVGSPIVAALVPALAHTTVAPGSLQTFVYAAPRFGPAPLATTFTVQASGGSGTYPLEEISFGDRNATVLTGPTVNHTYATRGVYSVQSYVVDSTGNVSVSPPVVVVVGGGKPLAVSLVASTSTPAPGSPVTFTATVTGGTGSYLLNFSFGDGSFAQNLTTLSANHAFSAAGGYCVEAVARDNATPPDGGASARLAVEVGGAAAPSCGNPTQPLTITTAANPGIRDAPADFPGLFTVSGGSTAPNGLASSLELVSNDPYTDPCGCTIFRAAGNYTVQEWANDTVDGEANATTKVTVAPPLDGTFHASTLNGTAPLTVAFTATATGGYLADDAATSWEFGNGKRAVGAAVQTTYTSAGEYLAVGALSDHGSGNASEAFLIDVHPSGSSGLGVSATITPARNISSSTNVTLSASLQGPHGELLGTSVSWNLGNGETAYGASVTETYLVGQDILTSDTLAAGVAILGGHLRPALSVPITLPSFFATEAGGFTPAASALGVSESVLPATGLIPLAITGNASASGPGGAYVSWLFGDGTSASGFNVTHTYYQAGPYTVNLTAYDAFNDQVIRLESVVASPALTVQGGPSPTTGYAPLTVNFSVVAFGGSGPPYSYLWSYLNGATTNASNLTIVFDTAGHYTVALNVTDPDNASLVMNWTITVKQAPLLSVGEILALGAGVGLVMAVVAWRRPSTEIDPFTL